MLQKFLIILRREVRAIVSTAAFLSSQRRTGHQQPSRVDVRRFVRTTRLRARYTRRYLLQMRNSVLEFCSIAHYPNFIPDELLHLAHKPFESGVDWPVRISYARLNPGLGWATTKFVTHLPPRPCAKNETVKQGIAGQPIGAVHACSGGLACCI